MVQKVVTLTLEKLDITQLTKMRECLPTNLCNRGNYSGAYRYEIAELLDAMILAGYSGKTVIRAPDLTV